MRFVRRAKIMVETLNIKMPVAENNSDDGKEQTFTFNSSELKFFALEIKDMIVEGKDIDLGKAARNAKYLAEIERRANDLKSGRNVVTFTDEEWENLSDE